MPSAFACNVVYGMDHTFSLVFSVRLNLFNVQTIKSLLISRAMSKKKNASQYEGKCAIKHVLFLR